MCKRLLLIGVVCMSLTGLLATQGGAWPLPRLPSGWPIVTNTDLTIIQLVKGVKCDELDGEIVCVELVFFMDPTEVSFAWQNPAGQRLDRNGVPFLTQGPISAVQRLTESEIEEKINWITVEESYAPDDLYEFVKDYLPTWDDPEYGAPNANWTIDPNSIVFEQLHLAVGAYGVNQLNTAMQLGDCVSGLFTRPPGGGIYGVIWDPQCPDSVPPFLP